MKRTAVLQGVRLRTFATHELAPATRCRIMGFRPCTVFAALGLGRYPQFSFRLLATASCIFC